MTSLPSSFYEQFKSAKSYLLEFPHYGDDSLDWLGKPYCSEAGALIPDGIRSWELEEITAVDLGGGMYQIAEYQDLAVVAGLQWGDVFYADIKGEGVLKLTGFEMPMRYVHYNNMGGGGVRIGKDYSDLIHSLGGGWGFGLWDDIIIPSDKVSEYEQKCAVLRKEAEGQVKGCELEESMKFNHVVLLGDSIFDNDSYVQDGLSVFKHLQQKLGQDWHVSLLAVDGDVTRNVLEQLQRMPKSATHLVVSVGGNDLLNFIPKLIGEASSIMEALAQLDVLRHEFRNNYASMLNSVLEIGLPTAVCTVYECIPGLSNEYKVALVLFNEIILREAEHRGVSVIDLRSVCTESSDYSIISPIEPSHSGGEKIAMAISKVLG